MLVLVCTRWWRFFSSKEKRKVFFLKEKSRVLLGSETRFKQLFWFLELSSLCFSSSIWCSHTKSKEIKRKRKNYFEMYKKKRSSAAIGFLRLLSIGLLWIGVSTNLACVYVFCLFFRFFMMIKPTILRHRGKCQSWERNLLLILKRAKRKRNGKN